MSQTVTRTNTKILVIIFVAWTLTNMDQAFFGYAIPGILEKFNLPLEAAGIVLTISLMGFLWFYESRTEDIIWYGLTAALLYGSLAVLCRYWLLRYCPQKCELVRYRSVLQRR